MAHVEWIEVLIRDLVLNAGPIEQGPIFKCELAAMDKYAEGDYFWYVWKDFMDIMDKFWLFPGCHCSEAPLGDLSIDAIKIVLHDF